MQRKLIGILSLLLSSLLFAVPASAVNLPLCAAPDGTSEFVLIAEDNIIFEPQSANSGRVIDGNVLVTAPHPVNGPFNNTGKGFVKVGSNTNINGTVIADVILLPDAGATIKQCVANTLVANTPAAKAVCGPWPCAANVNTCVVPGAPFTAYATAHPTCVEPPLGTLTAFPALCGPTPTVNPCVVGRPPLTVGVVFPNPLAPGCYGALKLENGAVLEFAPGVFTFASVKMNAGSRLVGPATVNVNGDFKTDAGVFITDINLNIALQSASEVLKIFNNSILTSTVINAPFGKCHLHTGTALASCSEACCKVLDVEPITAECDRPESQFCACPTGFKFLNPWQVNPNVDPGAVIVGALQDSRTCVPCEAGDHPPAFPTCPPLPE
jgi:hypothetical protein